MTGHGWESVRAEVLHRIRARVWPPGGIIPTEAALAQEFGCARATVSRALRELAAAGVLERRRKAGTRVALQPVRRAVLDIPVTRAEVEGRGQVHAHRLLADAMAVPPLPVSARLRLPPDAQLRHLRTLHFADGRPFLHEDRWVNAAALPLPAPDFTQISANEWLVANVPFTTGDIAFSAEAATGDESQALGVADGAALFVTERTTWTATAAITLVRLAHAPGYRLHAVL